MKNSRPRFLFILFLLIFPIIALRDEVLGQARPTRTPGVEPTPTPKPKANPTNGPIRPGRTVKDDPATVTKTVYERVVVRPKPNKGYLSVLAHPAATVTLTPLSENRKNTTPIKRNIQEKDGSLNLIHLIPGRYKILIEHDDYEPFSDTIEVEPASPDFFVARDRMISKYGDIRIGGVLPGAKVFLDGKLTDTSNASSGNSTIYIDKVPVGKYQLRVSKDGFVDYEKAIEVFPGKEVFEPVQLVLAIATLNIESQPGARIYVDGEEKTTILSDGKVSITLTHGPHKIRATKEGYQEWSKDLTLSRANNPLNLPISLIPIPISAEGNWDPVLDKDSKWYPRNSGWKFNKSGALIKGDKIVLFDTELNSDFNNYQNFKLEFDVVFNNGKGVAWVARAKDPNNYYLFEIIGPGGGAPTFNFYICQEGKLQSKGRQRVVEKMDNKDDTFHITFVARGNRFETRMTIASAPSAQPHLIGIFEDNSFSVGGVGFRGKDQSEALLQTFFVIPLK